MRQYIAQIIKNGEMIADENLLSDASEEEIQVEPIKAKVDIWSEYVCATEIKDGT